MTSNRNCLGNNDIKKTYNTTEQNIKPGHVPLGLCGFPLKEKSNEPEGRGLDVHIHNGLCISIRPS